MLTIFLVALFVAMLEPMQPVGAATTDPAILAHLKTLNETCRGQELCDSNHYKDVSNSICGCGADCATYGDCCRDSFFFSPSDCVDTLFACVPQPDGISFYMINKCPANTDPGLRQLCENPKPSPDPFANNIPVTVHSQSGSITTYQNANCAKCHGATMTSASAKIWTPLVQCYDNVVPDAITDYSLKWNDTTGKWGLQVNGTILFYQCTIDFRAPDDYLNDLRACRDGGFVDTCLPEWKDTFEEGMCRSYTAFVLSNSTSFRNFYCAKCNNRDTAKLECADITLFSGGRGAAFSNLLKLDKKTCQKNETYDPIYDRCRGLVCPIGKEDCLVDFGTVPKRSNTSRIEECFRVVLGKKSFRTPYRDNRTVWVEKYGRNFTEGQFLVNKKGQLEICVEDVPQDRYSYAMGIVTVVGLGLSIFFLVLHLCAMSLVPELRNHSGMNLSSLCIALLGAYISFIAGAVLSEGSGALPRPCAIVAVLTYYFFLSAFFWMLIIAFDVWRVLRGAVRHLRTSSGRQYCRFFVYSLFSWGAPAMLTVAAILVEMAPPGRVDDRIRPRFGSESCWFSRRLSLIVFFATPLAVIMALNVIFFVSSAFMASTSQLSSPSSNVSGHKRDFRLYLRLAILLGLTWVVGLLAAVMDYEPLWICFVLFNTLQGLFIFAVFTCTSKVFNGLTNTRPWASRLRSSLRLPPAKPKHVANGSDVGLSTSTTDTTLNKSNSTSVELNSHALPSSQKSSTQL